jgi:DNA-binding MarR family transcriptional regulator
VFIGRGLRDVWGFFVTELLDGLRQAGHPDATMAGNQVLLSIDPTGTTVSELSRRVGVTKQSMAQTVAGLETLDLVERRSNPDDRRAQLVTLTPAGWQALHAGLAVVQAIHDRWSALLGRQRMNTLVGLLEDLDRALIHDATKSL